MAVNPRRASSSRRATTTKTAAPRKAAPKKTTPVKKAVPQPLEVDELEGSAVSVEENIDSQVEPDEVDEDLTEEEAEDFEDEEEEDDDEYEEEEDEESISEDTQRAIAEEMEKEPESEPVKMRRLTIAEIRAVNDITEEEFPVEEWGGTVLLRSPKARQIIDMVKSSGQGAMSIENGKAKSDDIDFDVMMSDLIKMTVVDPPIDDEGYEILMEKSAGPVMEIFSKIQEIAKLDRISGGKKIDAVKEEEKQFRKG